MARLIRAVGNRVFFVAACFMIIPVWVVIIFLEVLMVTTLVVSILLRNLREWVKNFSRWVETKLMEMGW